jgi:hypothetical protein
MGNNCLVQAYPEGLVNQVYYYQNIYEKYKLSFLSKAAPMRSTVFLIFSAVYRQIAKAVALPIQLSGRAITLAGGCQAAPLP